MQSFRNDKARSMTTSRTLAAVLALGLAAGSGWAKDISLLNVFYKFGVRMLGFIHFKNNQFGDSATDKPQWNGLSPRGRELAALAGDLGMVPDASHASDAVFDQLMETSRAPIILSHSGCRAYSACSRASRTKSVRIELLTRQPTIRRAKTSITKATYCHPCHVETYVKSDTHSWFGRSARNCRLTLSNGHGAFLSLIVVRTTLPRIAPHSPSRRISRSTVHRATAVPSRASWRQTLSAP
jgi:hypothetical protein